MNDKKLSLRQTLACLNICVFDKKKEAELRKSAWYYFAQVHGKGAGYVSGRFLQSFLSFVFLALITGVLFYYQGRGAALIALSFFSFIGGVSFILPPNFLFARLPSIVFMTVPLAVLFINKLMALNGDIFTPSVLVSIVFLAELLVLLSCLWKEMEAKERFYSFLFTASLMVFGVTVSAGGAGAVVLFMIAYFTDTRSLGAFALVLFAGFCIAFLLSLPATFSMAALVCGLGSLVLWRIRRIFERSIKREKTR